METLLATAVLATTALGTAVLAAGRFAGAIFAGFTDVRVVLAVTARRAEFAGDVAADLAADFATDLVADLTDADFVGFLVEPRAAFAGERTFFTELLFITAL
jgi:hypothetical protein